MNLIINLIIKNKNKYLTFFPDGVIKKNHKINNFDYKIKISTWYFFPCTFVKFNVSCFGE